MDLKSEELEAGFGNGNTVTLKQAVALFVSSGRDFSKQFGTYCCLDTAGPSVSDPASYCGAVQRAAEKETR